MLDAFGARCGPDRSPTGQQDRNSIFDAFDDAQPFKHIIIGRQSHHASLAQHPALALSAVLFNEGTMHADALAGDRIGHASNDRVQIGMPAQRVREIAELRYIEAACLDEILLAKCSW